MSEARMQEIRIEAAMTESVTPAISTAGSPLLRAAIIAGTVYLLLELFSQAGIQPLLA
jgi:hypothetical protein